ncbi:DUF6591 domain-containing protein [Ruminococcus sp.]|uniref:DUF6591 domain-containing protein n=1 Tax=Ruminococcus sp. TaxID=41978 RepID=UPI003F02E08E
MYCSKCGNELLEGVKFCPKCGKKTSVTNSEVANGDMVSDNNASDEMYTGNKNYVAEKTTFFQMIKNKSAEFWNKLSMYDRVIIICLLVCSLFCLIAFLSGKVFSGIISLVQVALFVVALLVNKQIIKTPKKWISILSFALAFSLIVPYLSLFSSNLVNTENDYKNKVYEKNNYAATDSSETMDEEKHDWADELLINCLPKPQSDKYELLDNTDEYLSVDVYEISKTEFLDYVKSCKEAGFTVETEVSDTSFFAYNQEGYKLNIDYNASEEKMHISVEAPVEMSNIQWSDFNVNKIIPTPKSKTGIIEQDDEDGLKAYIGKTSISDYNEYVNECIKSGFNVDSDKSEKSFSAKNSEDYSLKIEYKGNSVVYIDLYVPEYIINIEVNCVENLIFSKYDVEIYVDDEKQGTLDHGKTDTYTVSLKRGTHKIKCHKLNDSTVKGEATVEITKDETIKIELYCTSDEVKVDNLSETTPVETSETEESKTESKAESKAESSDSSSSSKTYYEENSSDKSSEVSNKTDNYSNDRNEDIVYITPTGKKYHRSYCRTVKGESSEIKRGDAEAQGYDACKVCNP